MIIQMIKQPGGLLFPASDCESERMKRFKNGGQYAIDIKTTRNPDFHRKVFAFFNFCFDHWCAENSGLEFIDEFAQFDAFRRNLTVLAGFREVTYTIDGRTRVDAKSLAYGNMDQDEFERCYNAMINAAIKHIFHGNDNQDTWNRLQSFF